MFWEKINNDLKEAMKKRDQAKTLTLRLLVAALKNKRIELGHDLSESEALTVVRILVKQYQDSIADFRRGAREDLAGKTENEVALLASYLPPDLSEEELQKIAASKKAELNALGTKDFGRLMNAVMKEVEGRSNGEVVSKIVRQILG